MLKLDNAPVYKAHRMHITRLYSRPYVSLIVRIGIRQPMTKDSLTATVMRVPGEYPSEAEAIQAAMHYIDEQEAHRRDPGEEHAAPTPAATDRALAHSARSPGQQEQSTRQLRLYEA